MTIDPTPAKDELRRAAISRRRAMAPDDRFAARRANAAHLLAHLLGQLDGSAGPVCLYRPLPSEPLAEDLLTGLAEAGVDVLVPVVTGAAPLDWTRFRPHTDMGDVYLPEGDRLGPSMISQARIVVVPAFAVDQRGYRLGRGGGHYDRTLALADPGTVRIATLFDGEGRAADLPIDRYDQPVELFVSPTPGVVPVTV
ncbi:5-formyltetrahydrofolate cyclo-ligase [Nakamurella silvestris]|nr:5-formyltetrahydrofolate cyclo-ligase [Nakamurella silvestris]